MPRNIEGLKRSARLRSKDAMERALIALRRMEESDREINFRTVAVTARISTAWLYSQRELRGRIMRLRKSQTSGFSAESRREESECVSMKSIIATLRLRIKKLEERNRELTDLLERAYGVIATKGHCVSSTASEQSSEACICNLTPPG
jgi:Family of unknown function (DUF6262)